MTGRSVEDGPHGDRGEHPYVDQFTNEWAWRFEDGLQRLAGAATDASDFRDRLVAVWEALGIHKREMAVAWAAFVARKVADAARSDPIDEALRQRDDLTPPAVDVAAELPPGEHQDPAAATRAALARLEEHPSQGDEPPTLGAS